VRIFKSTWFSRFADKEGIADNELWEAVNLFEAGQADANLDGNVYKVRVARPNEGKSGGYRVILLYRSGERAFYMYGFAKSDRSNISRKYRSGERAFYMYGFAKSDRSNISRKELVKLKKQAASLFSMTDAQITTALMEKVFNEIQEACHER